MGFRKDHVEESVAMLLRSGLAYHQAGRLEQARREYESALEMRPDDADALHYLGVIAHQKGDHARAIELIERALKARPREARMYCNLADAQRAAGDPIAAEQSARRALELRPSYPEAQVNLAAALFRQKRFADAEQAARAALAIRPDLKARMLLGDALREQRRFPEAEQCYRAVLDEAPRHADALTNLGWMLVQSGVMEEGLALCRRAAEESPRDASLLLNLGRALLEFGQLDEAMDAFERALKVAPDSAQLSLQIGAAWQELGDLAEAQGWVERALKLEPAFPEARMRQAMLEFDRDEPEAAIGILDAFLADNPSKAEALLARAKARLALGDVDGAVADHRAAIAEQPDSATLHAALGGTLASAGDIEGAVACQRKAIELNPRCVPAYAGLLTAIRHKAKAAEREGALGLLDMPWMTDGRRASLHYGLAAYFDGKAEYASAAHHLTKANVLRLASDSRLHRVYDAEGYADLVGRIIETFTPELFERMRPFGSTSERPIFIVGMPRSGTTLTEQIIASHPAAFGAGERRFAQRGLLRLPREAGRPHEDPLDCVVSANGAQLQSAARWHLDQLDALDGGRALRIADKMPDNFSLLGWLALLFPRARFVHCRRDLRDIALSCWITNFSQIRWANDLEHLASRIEQYQRLMDHWRRVLPVPIRDFDYEALVADQVGQSRRLIAAVGLDWDDRCLSFFKTQRLVRTASVTQVREPIYNRSIARWTHYEEQLRPLIDRLGLGRTASP